VLRAKSARPKLSPILGGLLTLMLVMPVSSAAQDPRVPTASPLPDSMEVVGAFDYDWSVWTAAGDEVELSEYRGEVLVVNLWATWCPPCVAELGTFERLRQALDNLGSGVKLLLVSPEEPDLVREFAARQGLAGDLVTEARRMPESLGDLVLPTTFVVDRAGRIVLRHRGASDWAQPEVLAFLRALEGVR